MSIFSQAVEVIDRNRNNKFNCIPYDQKLPRFSEYLPGIQQGTYTIVSGASGSGKSQFTDDFFVFTPYDFLLENDTDIKLKVLYYSLELDKISKMHNWIARRLYTNYGIRTSMKILRSIGKNRVNDHIRMAVQETESYFEKLEDIVRIHDGIITPQRIIKDIENYAKENGTIYFREEIRPDGSVEKMFNGYKSNNPKEYVVIILDHYSLLTGSLTTSPIKQTIEELSRYLVLARNRYNYIPVPIQQQNGQSEDIEHYKLSKMLPSKDGLAESKLTYNDCDMALGIFQPQKHEIKSYRGYNVFEMGDGFRYLNMFKNRYGGSSNIGVSLYFDGAVNYFSELPRSDSINQSHYEMIKNRKPNW